MSNYIWSINGLMSEQHLISTIVLYWVLVILKSFAHHYLIVIKKNESIHSGRVKLMMWGIYAVITIFYGALYPLEGMIEFMPVLFFMLIWHQVIFGPGLNLLRGLNYFHLGKESGGFDGYFVNHPKYYKVMYFIYCGCGIVSIFFLNRVFRP